MRLEEMPTLEGEIERLKQQLAECQAQQVEDEISHTRWMEISRVSGFQDGKKESLTQLTECQAREREKNEALRVVQAAICLAADDAPESTIGKLYDHVSKVVVMPSDSTALDTLLKAAELKGRRGLLNRLHKVADTIGKNTTSQEARDSIRNLAKELE